MHIYKRLVVLPLTGACMAVASTGAYASEPDSIQQIQKKHEAVIKELQELQAELTQLQQRKAEIDDREAEIRSRIQQIRDSYENIGATSSTPAKPQSKKTKVASSAPAASKARKGNGLISVRYVYESPARARAALATLKSRDVNAYISEGQGSYRVYLGAYQNERTALNRARRYGPIEGMDPEIFFPD